MMVIAGVALLIAQTVDHAPYAKAFSDRGHAVTAEALAGRRVVQVGGTPIRVELWSSSRGSAESGAHRTKVGALLSASYWSERRPSDALLSAFFEKLGGNRFIVSGDFPTTIQIGVDNRLMVELALGDSLSPRGVVEMAEALANRVRQFQAFIPIDPRGELRPLDMDRRIDLVSERDLHVLWKAWKWENPLTYGGGPTWFCVVLVEGVRIRFTPAAYNMRLEAWTLTAVASVPRPAGEEVPRWRERLPGALPGFVVEDDSARLSRTIELAGGVTLTEFKRRIEALARRLKEAVSG